MQLKNIGCLVVQEGILNDIRNSQHKMIIMMLVMDEQEAHIPLSEQLPRWRLGSLAEDRYHTATGRTVSPAGSYVQKYCIKFDSDT